jgi:hypothetical protein
MTPTNLSDSIAVLRAEIVASRQKLERIREAIIAKEQKLKRMLFASVISESHKEASK